MLYPRPPGGPDDFVMIHPRGDVWNMMLAAIDRADLIGEPRFDDEDDRMKHCEEAANVITEWTKRHTKSEAMQTLDEAGVLAGATLGFSMTTTYRRER